MAPGYSFRPRAWAVLLAAGACAAGIALGNWQAGRAEEKRALGAQRQWVAVDGRFVDEHTVLLDNKLRRGRPGYEVVTPLRLNGTHVLVNRGWVAAGRTREELPQVPAPAGVVRIEGWALAHLPQVLVAGKAGGKVRPSLELEAFQSETGLQLQPFVIEQHSPAADGLVRDWPRPDAGVEKHESYALQWYSLAVLAVILLVVLSIRRVAAR